MLRTAIGAENQPQLATVTFKTIDRNGRPQADLTLADPVTGPINLATGKDGNPRLPGTGIAPRSRLGVVMAVVPDLRRRLSLRVMRR